jgi:hypothetical protein
MSSHFSHAARSETRVFRKSVGTLWTTPAESFLVMALLYTWSFDRCAEKTDQVSLDVAHSRSIAIALIMGQNALSPVNNS